MLFDRPKTKIIATIGPVCDSEKKMIELIKAGASIFRFNTKHGSLKWHASRIARLRKVSKELDIPVATMMVLRGPELRVGIFPDGQMKLKQGETVWLRRKAKKKKTDREIVLPELRSVKGLKQGMVVYLDDGFLELKIIKVIGFSGIETEVIEGGWLKDNKSINFPGARIDLPSLIKKDLQFLSIPNRQEIDFFSYSFVRNRRDILELRKTLKKQGLKAKIIAKIETKLAIDNFEEILKETDAVMIARGDLGVEIPMEEVPFNQKRIIRRCREEAKPVIVATQMLESMIEKPRPTRAEASDVANAVYDATDAIMLSAETAMGKFPIKVVETMVKIASFSEERRVLEKVECKGRNLTEVVSFSAMKMLNNKYFENNHPRGFVVFTDSGVTVRFLSRLRPSIPIFAITDNKQVRDQLCLFYGVCPFYHKFPHGRIRSTRYALEFLKRKGVLKKDDRVILIYGKQWGIPGGTNTIRVEEIK